MSVSADTDNISTWYISFLKSCCNRSAAWNKTDQSSQVHICRATESTDQAPQFYWCMENHSFWPAIVLHQLYACRNEAVLWRLESKELRISTTVLQRWWRRKEIELQVTAVRVSLQITTTHHYLQEVPMVRWLSERLCNCWTSCTYQCYHRLVLVFQQPQHASVAFYSITLHHRWVGIVQEKYDDIKIYTTPYHATTAIVSPWENWMVHLYSIFLPNPTLLIWTLAFSNVGLLQKWCSTVLLQTVTGKDLSVPFYQ